MRDVIERHMQFSEHFASSEFEKDGPIPTDCYPVFVALCQDILEPIRAHFGKPMDITSGYRPPAANAAAHGVPTSEHIAIPGVCCACDFKIDNQFGTLISNRVVFDWIRTNPLLPFHQVIFEHAANGTSIIHVSYDAQKVQNRSALEGAEYNQSPYTHWECADYQLPQAEEEEKA